MNKLDIVSKIIKYWKEFIFFSSYLIVLLICKSPDISSNFMGFDTLSLFYSCKFLEIRYPVPLYILFGYPLVNLPFGSDGGNLVFLSIIPSFLSSILVFLSIKNMTDNKIAPWIGAAALMGSYIYFSQSIIVNKYAFISVMSSFMLYFYSARKYAWSGFFGGLAMASHYAGGFVAVIAFFCYSRELRKFWYVPVITFLTIFLGFYIFVPKFYWDVTGDIDLITRFLGPLSAVFINLMISWFAQPWNVGLLIVSFGLTLIPMFLFVVKSFRKATPYLFILLLPVISYIAGEEYRFFTFAPFMPFYAVMAGLGIVYIQTKYLSKIILISSLLMMLSMPLVLNANSIDDNPTTLRDCINQLNEVENNSIVLTIKLADYQDGVISDVASGHIFPMVEYYNRVHGKDLIPMSIVTTDENIIKKLKDHDVSVGVFDWNIERNKDESIWHWNQRKYDRGIQSICDANPNKNVYYYKLLDSSNGKSQLVKAQ